MDVDANAPQLLRCERELVRMASIFTVDVDCVEAYATYFDIALIPSTIFFWNATHIKVDFGWCVRRWRF